MLMVSEDRLLAEALSASLANRKSLRIIVPPDDEPGPGGSSSSPVDVILIDVTTERAEALVRTLKLKEKFAGAKLVVLGLDREDAGVLDFVEAGAVGYVLKGASLAELVTAIESAYRGETVCSPQIASSVLGRILELSRDAAGKRPQQREVAPLTPREAEILGLIAAGLGNKEIARRLSITVQTVKNHVHNLLEKLEVHHRREAVRLAYELGLIAGPPGTEP